MIDMGLDFKTPRKDDLEAWLILKALADNRFAFTGAGAMSATNPLDVSMTCPRGSMNIEGRAWESRF